jgi:hypothetical protein
MSFAPRTSDDNAMPPRWLSLAIIVFWLAANGWLFWDEAWPYLLPGQPPPYTVDLLQEAEKLRPEDRWVVTQNGQKVFLARTSFHKVGADEVEATASYVHQRGMRDQAQVRAFGKPVAKIKEMRSRYRLRISEHHGELQSVTFEAEGDLFPPLGGKLPFKASLGGDVEGGRLAPRLRVEGLNKPLDHPLPEVEVTRRGSVLMPLHPPDRLRGLRPGQRWRQPVLDPLMESVRRMVVLPMGDGPRFLAARVRREPETLTYRRQEVPCLVIDYEGEEKAHTWLDQRTGLVLRHEAEMFGDRWVMERE